MALWICCGVRVLSLSSLGRIYLRKFSGRRKKSVLGAKCRIDRNLPCNGSEKMSRIPWLPTRSSAWNSARVRRIMSTPPNRRAFLARAGMDGPKKAQGPGECKDYEEILSPLITFCRCWFCWLVGRMLVVLPSFCQVALRSSRDDQESLNPSSGSGGGRQSHSTSPLLTAA